MAAPKTPAPAAAPPFDLNAAVAQLKSLGGAGTSSFIGLPSQQTTSAPAMADIPATAIAPRYYNGAEYLPVQQNMSPQDIATIQTHLVNAGLLDTSYRAGVWDASSQSAFKEVLGVANNSGTTWDVALANYESGTPMQWDPKTGTFVKGATGTARTRAPVVANFTSPDDLALTAQGVATAKLGRSFSPAELQKFIAAYHGTEQSAANAATAASGVAGGGYTSPASPTAAATTFAQQTDPNAYNAEQFLPLVDKMNQLLSGPSLATTKPMSA